MVISTLDREAILFRTLIWSLGMVTGPHVVVTHVIEHRLTGGVLKMKNLPSVQDLVIAMVK